MASVIVKYWAIGAETPEFLSPVSERMAVSTGGGARLEPAGLGDPRTQLRALPLYFVGDTIPVAMWRKFTVPWAPDDRIERLRNVDAKELSEQEVQRMTQLGATAGGFPRVHGSPYFGAKRPDLRVLKYSRYLDATPRIACVGRKTSAAMQHLSPAPIEWNSDRTRS